MYNVEISGRISGKYKIFSEFIIKKVFEIMKQPVELEVALEFVSENEIQSLNRTMRNIDRVTDVLSFPSTNAIAGKPLKLSENYIDTLKNENGYIHFGDIAICAKQARRQAKEYGNTFEEELKKLLIHSMLHLMGYDHIKDEDYEIMNKKENELDKIIEVKF